eukprot:TRINITY_DN5730_c0_g1_i2.p1 TRINITY_DN5730_c0_g1~~TRINITY_DN5730_c0_g1_i2.p1  ORF type:complete len:968 (+),score=215.90 TRINITY_DN5730_c0_g1_i2:100-3003(+)
MAKRVDLKYIGGSWGHPKAKIFERQADLMRYLDAQPQGTPLKGFSVEAADSLVDRMRRGAKAHDVSLFSDPAANRAALIVPQKRFFVAATFDDVYSYLYDEEDVEDDREVELRLDGSVAVNSYGAPSTDALQLGSVYEIIREGCPCHVYFDVEVEYDKVDAVDFAQGAAVLTESAARDAFASADPSIALKPHPHPTCPRDCGLAFDPTDMTPLLLRELDAFLNEEYGIRIRKEMVVKLVSDYKHKFSAHYIIHLPDAAFRSNQHLGRFLTITDAVAAARVLPPDFAGRPVEKSVADRAARGQLAFDRAVVSAIDLAVYTRNRTFRCMSASKLGKKSHLHFDEADCDYPYFSDHQLFLASMVANVEPGVRLLEYGMDLAGKKVASNLPKAVGTGLGGGGGGSATSRSGPSPFPQVDAFIQRLVKTRPYANGGIVKWMQYDTALLYVISGTRYCHQVGREHKSNGIYLVVNFARCAVRQKCYDPDCGDYASSEVPLDAPAQASIERYFAAQAPPPPPPPPPPQVVKPVPFRPTGITLPTTPPLAPAVEPSSDPPVSRRPVPFAPTGNRPGPHVQSPSATVQAAQPAPASRRPVPFVSTRTGPVPQTSATPPPVHAIQPVPGRPVPFVTPSKTTATPPRRFPDKPVPEPGRPPSQAFVVIDGKATVVGGGMPLQPVIDAVPCPAPASNTAQGLSTGFPNKPLPEPGRPPSQAFVVIDGKATVVGGGARPLVVASAAEQPEPHSAPRGGAAEPASHSVVDAKPTAVDAPSAHPVGSSPKRDGRVFPTKPVSDTNRSPGRWVGAALGGDGVTGFARPAVIDLTHAKDHKTRAAPVMCDGVEVIALGARARADATPPRGVPAAVKRSPPPRTPPRGSRTPPKAPPTPPEPPGVDVSSGSLLSRNTAASAPHAMIHPAPLLDGDGPPSIGRELFSHAPATGTKRTRAAAGLPPPARPVAPKIRFKASRAAPPPW